MRPQGKDKRDTNRIGDLSEIKLITCFLQLGYIVFTPYGRDQRSDLIIEDSEGKFWRVQCKTARLVENGAALDFDTASHNVTGSNRRMKHYREDCDFFAVYNEKLNKAYLIPVDEVGGRTTLSGGRLKLCLFYRICHRGPIYRVLPRFIGGLSPSDQAAITTKGSPPQQEMCCRSGIGGIQRVPDKSGQDPINRPSMALQIFPV
jgi:hypothetical protein